MATTKKRLTLAQLNKLFKEQNPTGEIWKEKGLNYSVAYQEEGRVYNYYNSNLYDLALKLQLVTPEEVHEMKKASGYFSHQDIKTESFNFF